MNAPEGGSNPPTELLEYRLIRPIGHGAMGEVYLAEDQLLARLVAIKFIAAACPSSTARENFLAEARAVARLSHPNVVAVHRVGEVRQRPFLVTEYVRGRNLAELDKPIPWREALTIAIDLARGLAAAHRRGVLHRDIKPANAIISEEGTVKLLDFGVAELLPVDESAASARALGRADEASEGAWPLSEAEQSDPALATTVESSPFATASATISLARTTQPLTSVGVSSGITLSPGRRLARADHARRALSPCVPPRVVGTPLYMAPEIWRGEPATTRADVYSLGALIYELVAGAPLFDERDLPELRRAVLESDAPALEKAAPTVDPRFAAIVDRCLRRCPELRFADGDALREALEQLAALSFPRAVPEGNPYRGLLAFESEHRGLFFGRSAEILGILDRLRVDPFVLVAGDSGTGKSSLCRAGVLPAAAEGALGRPATIAAVILGRRPVEALAAALAALLSRDDAAVLASLRAGPAGRSIARELKRRCGDVILFIDQLEELCTLADPAEAALAAEALHGLVERGAGVRLLATARSDFLTRLSALQGLGDVLLAALFLLRPLTAPRLREAVTGPAAAKGFAFESSAVVDALVSEAQRAEGGLPLLQFALAELWEARDEARRVIPASALESIGGVAGALARHADGVLASLPPPHRAARAILLALVTAEGTRARLGEAELFDAARDPEAARAALDALVRGRLLVACAEEGGKGTAYAIAHEALLTGWETLRRWLGESVEGRAVKQRLERAAAEWERVGRSADALWGDRLLIEAAKIEEPGLGAREASFLAASRRMARRRRVGRWVAALAGPLAFGIAAMGVRVKTGLDRTAEVRAAQRALEEARASRGELYAARSAALARFDAGDSERAEKAWAEVLRLGADVDKAYAAVAGRLRLITQQDEGLKEARELLVDALYERADLADKEGRAAELDELVRQIDLEDRGPTSRWRAPVSVSIETSPPDAEVALGRFQEEDGRWTLIDEAALGKTPILDRRIEPGSVLLTLSAPGRATVRLPIRLERGEARRIVVDLPLASAVPRGFVYVPPGRFLYGSAGGEDARGFFSSQPIHAVETGAYLIAQSETTYAEWIEFLRDLPPEERRARAPNVSRQGFTLVLTPLADGDYQLTIGQEARPYVARTREPIRYLDRDRRATQGWLRFPVGGISFEDARAYMAWLDRTGRVPGARPCDEREWERAARGADGRAFPASERLNPDDANVDVTYGRNQLAFGPDEVGSHLASDSPFGIHDLAGNVWESVYSVERPNTPVGRGGSFFQIAMDARSENRVPDVSKRRDAFYGIRVCATPRGW